MTIQIPSKYIHRYKSLPKYCPSEKGGGKKTIFLISSGNFVGTVVDGKSQSARKENDIDRFFIKCLVRTFDRKEFFRGNLDAGRLNYWFEKGLFPVNTKQYNPTCFSANFFLSAKLIEKYK